MDKARVAVMWIRRLLTVSLSAASLVWGQITNINTMNDVPKPGSGNDYFHLLNATVNPENGSVSLRIGVPLPHERGPNIPFNIAYDSNGTFTFGAAHVPIILHDSPHNGGGWTYTVPELDSTSASYDMPVPDSPDGDTVTCTYNTNYVFFDPSGGRHPLGMADYSWNNQPPCPVGGSTSGWDDFFQATPNPHLVADLSGNVYNFAGGVIEDRNGNTLKMGGGSGVLYTDTLGRAVLSSSGFGLPSWLQNATYTLSISGLPQPYSITWGRTGIGFRVQYWDWNGTGPQWTPDQGRGTMPVITSVTLPNNTQYAFGYDFTYGLLNQITYPTGGWEKYAWGLNNPNSPSEASDFAQEVFSHDENFTVEGYIPHTLRHNWPAITDRDVSFDGVNVALHQHFDYATGNWTFPLWAISQIPEARWNWKQTTVTTTDNVTGQVTKAVYTYSAGFSGSNDPYSVDAPSSPVSVAVGGAEVAFEDSVTYEDGAGNPLQTVKKTWFDTNLLKSEQTILWPSGLASQVNYKYGRLGVLTEKDEFNFGQDPNTTPARKTITNYQGFAPSLNYPSQGEGTEQDIYSIPGLPCQTITYDSSGNRVAESDYLYDNGDISTLCGQTAGAPVVTAVNGLPAGTHDEDNYNASSTGPRGNVTTEIHKCFIPSTGASCQDSVIHYTYDETGQLTSKTDALGHVTTFDYTDHFTDGGTPPGNTNAFLTQVTYPTTNGISHIQSYAYAYQDGSLTSATDQNQRTTTYDYNDPLRRLTSVTGPPDPNNGGQQAQTTYFYNDNLAAFPMVYVMATTKLDSSNVTRTWTGFDGMGRKVRFAKLNGEASPNVVDMSDTCYDALGRVSVQNYPFQGTGWGQGINCSPATGDSFTYDALGRVTQVTHPDGSQVDTDYSQFPVVTVRDEARKQRRNQTDALGRLLTVWEPDGSGNFNYETDYQYDTLDNLIRVDQKGSDSNSANWRQRDFSYDSLSRLISATNPESGTITYGYDAVGNLTSKVSPMPNQTGSSQIEFLFGYDELNRPIWRWNHTQPSEPVDRFWYDLSSVWGTPVHNSIGRLVQSTSDSGNGIYVNSIHSYDVMGREEFELEYNKRGDYSVAKQFNYTYNLDGSLKTVQYPSGRTITYSYNTGQRPVSAVDVANDINYYTSAHYTAFGAPASMVYGATPSFAGITWNNTYNSRMQPVFLTAATPTSTIFSLGYDFHLGSDDNGNVYAVNNNKVFDHSRDQSFTYDQLNRLTSAQSAATSGPNCWGESFGYDPWGNLIDRSVTKCTGEGSIPSANTKNQMNGKAYDAAGNLLAGGYSYDSRNRLAASPGVTYDYDADGKRVQKSDGTLYWHGLGGEVLAETDPNGSLKYEYVFFGGRRIARVGPTVIPDCIPPAGGEDDPPPPPPSCSPAVTPVEYYFSDHLGSTDIVTNATGTIKEESEYYPFGGERVITDSGIGNNYKFTGKERDPETGCDYFGARYYCNPIGRFITPDWADKPTDVPYANFGNPQSLNLYSYVQNNPTTFGDPDGHACPLCPIETPTAEDWKLIEEAGKAASRTLVRAAVATATRVSVGTIVFIGVAAVFADKLPGGVVGESEAEARASMARLDQRQAQEEQQEAEPQTSTNGAGAMKGGGIIRDGNRGIDFSNYLKQDLQPGQKNSVDIQYTGSRRADFAAANKAAGFKTTPAGYTWHHLHNYNAKTNSGTMQLVQTTPHRENSHNGGVRQYEQATGKDYRP